MYSSFVILYITDFEEKLKLRHCNRRFAKVEYIHKSTSLTWFYLSFLIIRSVLRIASYYNYR